ncbi:MAG TPA: DUF6603 domain-containing protein [Thermoanaerobaculia bacterium]|jgi:hypothetical protein|nr:DUF6603 domain-containing protein [Thermoanaerobaculia bacterium]
MADEQTYVIRLVAWLGRAIGESSSLFTDFGTDDLGTDLPAGVVQAPGAVAALRQAEVTGNNVLRAATDLNDAAATTQDAQILGAFIRFGAALVGFYQALDALVAAVNAAAGGLADAAERAAAQNFAASLAKRLSDYALASLITDELPEFGFLLRVAGLLDWRNVPAVPGQALSSEHVRKSLELNRIQGLIKNPLLHFQQTLHWGANDFDPTDIFRLVRDFFDEEADVEVGINAGQPFLRVGAFVLRRDTNVPPGLILALIGQLEADRNDRFPVTDGWGFGVNSNLRVRGSVSGGIAPPFTISILSPTADITGQLKVLFDRNPDKRPFDILGGTGLLSIGARNISAGAALRAQWDLATRTATINPQLFAAIEGLTLRIGSSGADGFLSTLLGGSDVEGELDLGLEWAPDTGLRVTGSGGIELAIPLHRQLGPIEIQTIYVALKIKDDGTLALEVSSAIAAMLGPLTAVADRMGAQLDLRFASGTEGRFGPFDLALRFKPPSGVGLSVDAGPVRGGGFLTFDFDRGEYGGAMQLTFSGFLSLTAFGLINTRNPDGSSGFSLIIVITAEFGTGIQLGFGFTLIGVGGILGLNRSVNTQPLLEGARTGSINNILFPRNVAANAPRILSDLRSFFPQHQGSFLVGPLAKLGWGTPPLITATLAIIIEIPPGNLYILGVLNVLLPTEETAVLRLRVAFFGGIEFDKKRLFFFAGIFDSRILTIPIEGELGLVIAWGDDPSFVVTVGGFHPSFQPPPLPIPTPRRISVELINTPVAHVRVEGYFAVTSNTVQFGARAELFFGLDSVNVQGHIAFDALFQFSPFHFIITISASFSLEAFGVGLFSVRIRGTLEGTSPWRAAGEGSISLFFFDISADFDITWGERRDTSIAPVDVLPLLTGELNKKENWRAVLPPANNLLVALRKLPAEETLVLHPVGVLQVSQRLLPLDLKLDKVGNRKPKDFNRLSIPTVSGGLAKKGDTDEQFAPAQFQDFSDADKLSRPAYGPQHGGLELSAGGEDMRSSRCVERVVRYEEIILDNNFKRFQRRFKVFTGALFHFFAAGGAMADSELSKARKKQFVPFQTVIQVQPDAFTVALQANNQAWKPSAASFRSEASARDFMNQQVAKDPNLADVLHVIPSSESAA